MVSSGGDWVRSTDDTVPCTCAAMPTLLLATSLPVAEIVYLPSGHCVPSLPIPFQVNGTSVPAPAVYLPVNTVWPLALAMVMSTVASLGTLRCQVADEFVMVPVVPSTRAVLPTKPSAWVACVVCCRVTSWDSESLVLSCCSPPANCTSCWVNWLVSSGSSGFWFWSCVVSSVRKVWKLPASVAPVVEPRLDEDDFGRSVVPETTVGAVAEFVVVICEYSSHSDVDAAARSEHAAVAAAYGRGGSCVFVADDQPACVAVIVVALAGVLPRRILVAQAEGEPVAAGLEAGIVERALQLRRVLPQHRQRLRPLDGEMRGDLTVAVDVDADIDAAEIDRIEADVEAGLAGVRGRGDLDRQATDGHGRGRSRGRGQRRGGGGRG